MEQRGAVAGIIALFLLTVLSAPSRPASGADPLRVVGPVIPPLSDTDSRGRPTGTLVRRVRESLGRAGYEARIKLMPWHRAVTRLESRPETLIFPLTRTPAREEAYHWLVRLHVERTSITSLRGQPPVSSMSDIVDKSRRVGCSRGSVQCQLLRENGLPEKQLFIIHEHGQQTYLRLALNHRIDYFVADPAMMRQQVQSLGHDMDDFRVHFDIGTPRSLYLALSRKAPAALVRALKQSVPSNGLEIENSD